MPRRLDTILYMKRSYCTVSSKGMAGQTEHFEDAVGSVVSWLEVRQTRRQIKKIL